MVNSLEWLFALLIYCLEYSFDFVMFLYCTEYLWDSVVYEMSWNNTQTEVHHVNTSYPYNTAGSFLEYFEGLTYEHVNFIFSGASHSQPQVL